MEITLDKISNTQAYIKIKLNEADYQPSVEEKIKDYSRKAQIKGFRPGKVPPAYIKRLYGKSLMVEQINELLSKNLQEYIRSNDLNVLGEPLPKELSEEIDWDHQKEFEFEYELGFSEPFEITIDEKVVVPAYNIVMSDDTLSKTIENIREQLADIENPEISDKGDALEGTLVIRSKEIEKEVSIDTKELNEAGEKLFIGIKVESAVSFKPSAIVKEVVYASNFTGLSEEELKELEEEATFTVTKINRMKPAELTQEFFDKVFGPGAVSSQEEFEQKVTETMTNNYKKESDTYLDYSLKNNIIKAIKFELPDEFLKNWLHRINEGKFTAEEIEKDFDNYQFGLRWSIIKEKVAKKEEIKVETAEIIDEAKIILLDQLASSGIPAHFLEGRMDDMAERYLKDEKGENYMKVYNALMDKKILDFFKDKVTLDTKDVTVEEFNNLDLN